MEARARMPLWISHMAHLETQRIRITDGVLRCCVKQCSRAATEAGLCEAHHCLWKHEDGKDSRGWAARYSQIAQERGWFQTVRLIGLKRYTDED